MRRRNFSGGRVAKIIVMVAAGIFVFGGIVMLLWNALLPALFHFPVISFWQALGLLLLSKILFGGFRGPGGPGGPWKGRMRQHWMNMTPEERDRFRQQWENRCRKPFGRGGMYWQEPGPGDRSDRPAEESARGGNTSEGTSSERI